MHTTVYASRQTHSLKYKIQLTANPIPPLANTDEPLENINRAAARQPIAPRPLCEVMRAGRPDHQPEGEGFQLWCRWPGQSAKCKGGMIRLRPP